MTPAGSWSDQQGRPVAAPEPPAQGSYYRPIGDFQQSAYERNAFALGTDQEVGFLWDALGLHRGAVVVDVGCGTGRHSRALAQRGAVPVGVDISTGLLAVGAATRLGAYVQADARRLPFADGCADAVICLCQGGFGITPGGDQAILAEISRVLAPAGRLALTAFSLAFAARWLAPEDAVDVARGMVWSPAEVRGADDERRRFDLWTTCYSGAHLTTLIEGCGLELETLSGVEPGQFGHAAPTLHHPELLAVARRKNE